MHRDMSYRKPVPDFIPSPPPSPSPLFLSASRQEDGIPPLPDHWHDAIAQAQKTNYVNLVVYENSPTSLDSGLSRIQPGPSTIPGGKVENALELPQIASPVYFGSTFRTTRVGQHRIYRPPTPPRPNKKPRLFKSPNASEASLERRLKAVDLLHRSEGTYAGSIETAESDSRHASSVSLPYAEWRLAQLPVDNDAQENNQPVWWEKIKTVGAMIKSRLVGVQKYGPALC
ncbi:hypothetical protein C8R44DRAFT_777173 [Mycena epipterygia]|nr:hypothetical protein C8R44DRAFT_777173 [Mycena epipterygia]